MFLDKNPNINPELVNENIHIGTFELAFALQTEISLENNPAFALSYVFIDIHV